MEFCILEVTAGVVSAFSQKATVSDTFFLVIHSGRGAEYPLVDYKWKCKTHVSPCLGASTSSVKVRYRGGEERGAHHCSTPPYSAEHTQQTFTCLRAQRGWCMHTVAESATHLLYTSSSWSRSGTREKRRKRTLKVIDTVPGKWPPLLSLVTPSLK